MLPHCPHPRPEQTGPCRVYFGGFAQQPSAEQTRRYMRGECGYFALVLHDAMPGSRPWKVGIGHFAVEDAQGRFWDVRGSMDLAQLWSGLAGPQMTPLNRDALVNEIDTGLYGDGRRFVPSRATRARGHLRALLPDLVPRRRTRMG